MKFSLYIAKRYLFSKSKNNAINIITLIAGAGVFAGALALFIVLSGFSGLKAFSLQFTNDIDPDLTVLPSKGKTISLDSSKIKALTHIQGIQGFSKIIEERVLLDYEKRKTPAVIKGVDSTYNQVTATDKSIVAGRWFHPNENRVVMGSGLAQKLSLGVSGYGDVLQLLVPKPGTGLITDPREAFNAVNSLVVGVYSINEELDDKYVFAPLQLARQLLNLKPNEVSAIALKLSETAEESDIRKEVKRLFNQQVVVKNRIQMNDELYKMLNTENLAVYLIFTLVIIIALFNVGGAIVMAILDKRDNIKTLFYMGANLRDLKRIFFLQGTLLTFVGGLIGLLIGVIVIVLQMHYNLVMITPSLPYPVQLKAENIAIVFATIMILGILASYIGSTRVSKTLK